LESHSARCDKIPQRAPLQETTCRLGSTSTPLRADEDLVLTASSAAGALELGLLSADTVDAYLPAKRMEAVASKYGLEPAAANEANVIMRTVPDDAWLLEDRRIAPRAAVALDLASYPDSRSARIGAEVLAELDAARSEDR
jgi:hypothetical protein